MANFVHNMNQAINHRQYAIYCHKTNNVGFIRKYWHLLSNGPNKAHMPIFGHTFFGHYPAIFGQIGLKICYGNSRDYYLSIGDVKSKLGYLFFIFGLLGHFCGKSTLMVWGL